MINNPKLMISKWSDFTVTDEEDLEKFDEQKHPRKKDGKFAPKGMGEAGGAVKTSSERPQTNKPAPKSEMNAEIGIEVEGRPQMGKNFDFSAERDMFGDGKGYTQEQYMRFRKRELTVKYAETEPFNNEISQKEYIDKYIRRGWYPTDEMKPYTLVNPEGTRQRNVSRQGMKDYLDVVLNRGEYKANYDLPEGANVVPAPKAVPEREKTPEQVKTPEPDEPEGFEGMNGAQVAEKLLKTIENQEYDKNDYYLLKMEANLEKAKEKLKQLVGSGKFDSNNPEMEKALSDVTEWALAVGEKIVQMRESAVQDEVKKALEVKSRVKIKRHVAQGEYKFGHRDVSILNGGIDGFESIVSSNVDLEIQDVSFRYDNTKNRSGFNGNGGLPYVRCGRSFREEHVVHELGHYLEFYGSGVSDAAVAFFNRRTQGENPVPLKNFGRGFRDDEVCKPDKFVDPYVGKRYSDGATEVISVGLAYYYSDPVGFLRKDPDHFALIYDAVHGKFSKGKKGK